MSLEQWSIVFLAVVSLASIVQKFRNTADVKKLKTDIIELEGHIHDCQRDREKFGRQIEENRLALIDERKKNRDSEFQLMTENIELRRRLEGLNGRRQAT